MDVRIIYEPILRQVMKPVTVFDERLKKEADEMVATMHRQNGIGLAANQVGLDKQLIVLEFTPQKDDETPAIPRTQLCNPKITKSSSETEVMTEGCLSLPGLELPVRRSLAVVVEAQNLRGEKVTVKAKGLFARVLQHEIDHLNGVLFTDRAEKNNTIKPYTFAKVVFFGSDDFSLPVLKRVVETGYQVVAVFCESDKRGGRGDNRIVSPVKTFAEQHSIAVFNPETKEEIAPLLAQIKPDLLVLASYGKILPEEALRQPVFGCLNVHPSLLPRYRGATPIQSAILNGETETGVTIMSMAKSVDAGGVIAQRTAPILPNDTTPVLREKLAELGSQLLVELLPKYLSGQAKITAQDDALATRTTKLFKELGRINWEEPAELIVRKIRAFLPWPGTYTTLNGKRLIILEATVKDGTVLPIRVQLEGKTAVSWEDFLRGYQSQLTREPWYGKIYR